MKRIDALYQEILELERECPAPTVDEFKAMEAGKQPYRYEVFFLGLLGEIDVYLNEAVEALWKGYRRYNFSNFRRNLRRDSRLTKRAARILEGRAAARRCRETPELLAAEALHSHDEEGSTVNPTETPIRKDGGC